MTPKMCIKDKQNQTQDGETTGGGCLVNEGKSAGAAG